MIEHVVDLHIPECLPGDTEQERRRAMMERIEEDRNRFCREAGIDRHLRPDRPSEFTTMDWRRRTSLDDDAKSKKVCVGKDAGKVADYLDNRRGIEDDYREAADKWKAGKRATFPVGTYPPGCAQPAPPRIRVASTTPLSSPAYALPSATNRV